MNIRLLTLLVTSASLLGACTPAQPDHADERACVIGGCSSHLCIEEGDDGISTCEFRAEYACYKGAACERQQDGKCGWTQTAELSSCLQNPPSLTDEEEVQTRSMYSYYAPIVLLDGETKVLFFYAAVCPACAHTDATLSDWYNRGDDATMSFEELMSVLPPHSAYKVDFDIEADLRSLYGVTNGNTLVLIDPDGNLLRTVQDPSESELQEFIGAPIL